MRKSYKRISKTLLELGFLRICHLVVIHHLSKDFQHLNTRRKEFFILPHHSGFLHVALITYRDQEGNYINKLYYRFAASDLLYGLKPKFPLGGSNDASMELLAITSAIKRGEFYKELSYSSRHFKPHKRTQAKVRAFIVMFRDYLAYFFPFAR